MTYADAGAGQEREKGEPMKDVEAAQHAGLPRVVFVDHAASPGGGQLGALAYMKATKVVEPIAVYFADGPVAERSRQAGIETYVLFPGQDFSTRLLTKSVLRLRRLLKGLEPSIVVCASMAAAKTAALLPSVGAPSVLWLQEDLDRMRGRGIVTLVWLRMVLPAFDGFLSNSAWTQSTLPKRDLQRPHEVAFPVSGVSGSSDRTPVGPFAGRRVRIGTFSRPESWKGLDILVDALAQLHAEWPAAEFQLDMYGGGQVPLGYLEELRAKVDAASYPASLHGHVEDVPVRMACTDVMVLPSRLPEPYGQVVAQAMRAGCVVVISGHGGATEQITDGENGLWFAPGDSVSLAATLRRLWEEPSLPAKLSQAAAASVERLDDVHTVEQTDQAILTLLSQTASATLGRQIRRRLVGLLSE